MREHVCVHACVHKITDGQFAGSSIFIVILDYRFRRMSEIMCFTKSTMEAVFLRFLIKFFCIYICGTHVALT